MPTTSNRDQPLTFFNTSAVAAPEAESYLLDTSQNGSASGSFQNDEAFVTGDGADDYFGFSRSEFRQRPLVGTVEYYDRHVFLCYKQPEVWPPYIEAAEFDRLPRLLSAALASRKGDMKKQTCLTICEGHDGSETSNGDVLIFPDMIRYRRLTHFDVETFVEEVLVKDGEWLPGSPEPLKGTFVFVCAHGSRDKRCGVCGPAVIARFKREIELHGHQNKVFVRACSHIGGHKYAGNVIIFGSNHLGKVMGHWYGYVMPDDVPALLEHHVGLGNLVDLIWRGQRGLSEANQKNAQEVRVGDAACSKMEKSIDEVCNPPAKRGGSCQTNGTSTCCHHPPGDQETNGDLDAEFAAEKRKGIKNQNSVNMGSKRRGLPARRVCNMPTWLESWESEDVYAAFALIGAAVSVAVAYNCYRRLA